MPTLEEEVVEARTVISDELRVSRKEIDVFLLTMSQFQQNIEGFRIFSKEHDVTNQMTNFFYDVSVAAINYEVHFLNNFQRLLWKIKKYIESSEKRTSYKRFYQEILLNDQKIEQYKTVLDAFAGQCMKIVRIRKGEVLTKEEVDIRLNNALKTLMPFANAAPKEVFKHLESIERIIDVSRLIVE